MSSQQVSHVIRGRGSERSLVILSHAASRASHHSCVTFIAYTFITPYSVYSVVHLFNVRACTFIVTGHGGINLFTTCTYIYFER